MPVKISAAVSPRKGMLTGFEINFNAIDRFQGTIGERNRRQVTLGAGGPQILGKLIRIIDGNKRDAPSLSTI